MTDGRDSGEHPDSSRNNNTPPPPPGWYAQPGPYAMPPADDEIDLRELFGILWQGRWLILASTALFAVASIIYALLQTNIYRAEAVLLPAEQRQSGSPLASQFGSAAALVGIDVGPQGEGRVANAIAVLRSREFTREFVARHDLLVPLMAGTCCDADGGNLIDPEIYSLEMQSWLLEEGAPSDWDVYSRFDQIRSVSEEQDTGLIRVAIEWHDPQQAQQWVNWLVEDINYVIKERDLEEANSAIGYLQRQLESTSLVEMQQAFFDLIESQTRTVMLADVRDEYVFRIIDPAVAPEDRVRPQRKLIVIIGTLAGIMLGILMVLGRRVFKEDISEPQIKEDP